jgi:hypothetical protein
MQSPTALCIFAPLPRTGPAHPPTTTQPDPSFAPKHPDDVFLGVKVDCSSKDSEPALKGTTYEASACAEAVWAPGPTAAAEQDGSTVLRTLPAHRTLLSNSPYLLAQVSTKQLGMGMCIHLALSKVISVVSNTTYQRHSVGSTMHARSTQTR